MRIVTLPGVYPPSEDTFFLASFIEERNVKSKRVLDVGTGSGCLAVLVSLKGAHVLATDIQPRAILNARLNARLNGTPISLRLSDLFENVNGTFDFILFNPPYLSPWEEASDVSWDGGWRIVKRFLEEVEDFLSPDGCYAFVMEEDENWRRIEPLLSDVEVSKNAFHLIRVIGCR